MKKLTAETIREAVATLENVYLDNRDAQPMPLDDAVDYCYAYFVEFAKENCLGRDTSVFFDGKALVLAHIRQQILQNKDIAITDRYRFKLVSTGHSSTDIGPCECCGKHCREVFALAVEKQFCTPPSTTGEAKQGWTYLESCIGHKTCLEHRKNELYHHPTI